MQILKQKEDLGGIKVIKCPKPLFIRAKTFMKDAMRGNPSPNVEPHPHEIPSQYQEFKDVFEKQM
jgi:hypothetical protein